MISCCRAFLEDWVVRWRSKTETYWYRIRFKPWTNGFLARTAGRQPSAGAGTLLAEPLGPADLKSSRSCKTTLKAVNHQHSPCTDSTAVPMDRAAPAQPCSGFSTHDLVACLWQACVHCALKKCYAPRWVLSPGSPHRVGQSSSQYFEVFWMWMMLSDVSLRLCPSVHLFWCTEEYLWLLKAHRVNLQIHICRKTLMFACGVRTR